MQVGPPTCPSKPSGSRSSSPSTVKAGRVRIATNDAWVIDHAEQRKGDDLYLSVFVDNHRARKFYERWGFVAEGSYAFMVGTHADEDIVMRRPL